MDGNFPIAPPLVVKDDPKPRELRHLSEALAFVEAELKIGRPEPWRDAYHRLKTAATDDDAIEAIGSLRELLADEALLVTQDAPLQTGKTSGKTSHKA